jgi:DNA-directed RNA polymerase specialized sigma subunit
MTDICTGGPAGEHLFDALFDDIAAQDKAEPSKPLLRKQDVTELESNLAAYRWRQPILTPGEEADLIRRAQAGDGRAKDELLRRYHRTVLKVSKLNRYRGPLRDDLIAGGCWAVSVAIERFDLRRNTGLRAYAEHWIHKGMRKVVKDWRRGGQAGETRADRYAYSHRNATAQDIADKVGCSLADAQAAIDRQRNTAARHEHYSTLENDFGEDEDGDESYSGLRVVSSHDMYRMYDRFSRYQLAPQLRLHEAASRTIDELVVSVDAQARRRLQAIGGRGYARELVENDRRRATAHIKTEQAERQLPGRPLVRPVSRWPAELVAAVLRHEKIKQREQQWSYKMAKPENKIIAFRCPPVLVDALEAVAAEGFCSVSDVARQTILKSFRERGLIDLVGEDFTVSAWKRPPGAGPETPALMFKLRSKEEAKVSEDLDG